MTPTVSAIICTRNRVADLSDAIESITRQEVEPGFLEIIVVDNASSDSTREYVSTLSSRNTTITYLFEPVLGLSRARNAGVQTAKGQYLAFLDDDAVAEAGWLTQIPIAFQAGGPKLGCLAGKVNAIWSARQPPWLHDALLGYIGVVNYASEPIWLERNQVAFGCNAAYAREALLQVGGFSQTLGRKGTSLLSNEEILLQRHLERLGYRTYYDPLMAVGHKVSSERLSKSWFRRRAYWQGVSDALLEKELEALTTRSSVRKKLERLASIARRPRELAALVGYGDDPVQFLASCTVLTNLGYILADLHS
jgi:glucosyl-dolichyl phosphate glucuronosyltransferase